MYSIGQKVKCINGSWGSSTGTSFQITHCPNLPVVGLIYHIRSIDRATAVLSEGSVWFVRLVEIVNPEYSVQEKSGEPVFYARNFVPLQSDISFAYDILKNPQKIVKRDREEIERFKRSRRRERA